MEEKLKKLYNDCIKELETIGINILHNEQIGNIDIRMAKRNNERYGCCKQENPDKKYKITSHKGNHKIIKYEKMVY